MDNCRRTSFPPALDAWQMSLRGGKGGEGGGGAIQNKMNKSKVAADRKRREMQARGRRSSVPEQIHIDHKYAQFYIM